MKICTKCKKEKSLTEFYTDARTKNGRSSHCKVCHRMDSLIWWKEHGAESSKKWRDKNPEKSRKVKRGTSAIRYAISTGKLIRPDNCSECGDEERRIHAHHHKGYDRGNLLNVVWLCSLCHAEAHKV